GLDESTALAQVGILGARQPQVCIPSHRVAAAVARIEPPPHFMGKCRQAVNLSCSFARSVADTMPP
ncbi:MAG TPA: hypothetical protein PLI44_03545, partial [Chiayiivirga sp.]|nr:hypothetical protein [Chiayiivirga sp.]